MNLTVVSVRKRAACSVVLPVMIIMLLAAAFSPATGCPVPISQYGGILKDTILVQKKVTSKRCRIKLYPDANNEVLFFSVRGNEKRVYQLFLFDLEGRLVKQVNIRNKQTTILEDIDKGSYLFDVFSDDERIENGQVIIK